MHTTMLLAVLLLSAFTLTGAHSRSLEQYESVAQNTSVPPSAPEGAGPSAVASPAAAAAALNTTQVVEAVQKALKEPVPHIINLRTEYNTSGTSIAVGDAYAADTLAVQFRFSACAGIQIHHHSGTEFMQAVIGTFHVGIINNRNMLTAYNFTAGQAVVIPPGYPHYYVNHGCAPSILVATWPAGTKTTFELSMLSAINPAVFSSLFAEAAAAPVPKPGFPIIQDTGCLQRCGINTTNAANSQTG